MKEIAFALSPLPWAAASAQTGSFPKDDGYRGIWYPNQATGDEYHWKYSGGLGTYPQQQQPIAIHVPKVNKTFFCYGGTTIDSATHLLEMVSYYDHTTGMVPKPTILMDKNTDDAHDNSAMSIDDDGYIWIFSSAHGTARPSYIHRSRRPYDISEFDRVAETNFSYSQPWYISGQGFLFLHTRYDNGRRDLYWMTSKDGRTWTERKPLARIDMGHYQMSLQKGNRVITFLQLPSLTAGVECAHQSLLPRNQRHGPDVAQRRRQCSHSAAHHRPQRRAHSRLPGGALAACSSKICRSMLKGIR